MLATASVASAPVVGDDSQTFSDTAALGTLDIDGLGASGFMQPVTGYARDRTIDLSAVDRSVSVMGACQIEVKDA